MNYTDVFSKGKECITLCEMISSALGRCKSGIDWEYVSYNASNKDLLEQILIALKIPYTDYVDCFVVSTSQGGVDQFTERV